MNKDRCSLLVVCFFSFFVFAILLKSYGANGEGWVTIFISVVGGALVAWIAAYAGATAGGEIAKFSAIEGAERAGNIQVGSQLYLENRKSTLDFIFILCELYELTNNLKNNAHSNNLSPADEVKLIKVYFKRLSKIFDKTLNQIEFQLIKSSKYDLFEEFHVKIRSFYRSVELEISCGTITSSNLLNYYSMDDLNLDIEEFQQLNSALNGIRTPCVTLVELGNIREKIKKRYGITYNE